MSSIPGQLATGPAELHRLNTERGVTNIGSNPENDIVISGVGVQPFHLMLDHRQKPYRIVLLDPAADVSINGVRLAGMEPAEVMDLNQVQFAGYFLRAQEGSNGSPVESVAVLPIHAAQPGGVGVSGQVGQAPAASVFQPATGTGSVPVPVPIPGGVFQARAEDVILVELDDASQTINVEQTAIYQVTVINGGPIVASFDIGVVGLPAEWVEIVPPKLNLYEGSRAVAAIRITPPRDPASQAGEHPFQIQVLSPNYPGSLGQVGAVLAISPYYDFMVGNINPRSKSASWSKKSATTHFPISNYGNSLAGFTVLAQDEENGLQFEFPLTPGAALLRQAEVHVPPGETLEVPVFITPFRRRMVRVRGRQYLYSVTTTSLDVPTATRTVSGSFTSRPLFGIFSILLALILLAAAAYLLLQPRINEFTLAKDVIRLGETALLRWKVSIFTTDLRIDGLADPITGAQGQVAPKPTDTATTYTLVAGNWLSRMLRMEDLRSQPLTVLAIPPYPEIVTFFVDKNLIFQGDEIDIKWSVKNADEALLTVEGVTQTLKGDALNGEQKFKLKGDSLVILEARNNSGTVTRSDFVRARPISIVINNFSVDPKEIVKGDPVTIAWDVSGEGVESVMISPFTDPLPLTGSLKFFPTASTEFVLTVKARDQQEIRLLSVGVQDKIVPQAPTVDIFKVAPDTLAVGGGNVEFSWSVSGQTTKIEITSKDGVLATNLPAQGFRSYNVSKTTAFFLTAYNGSLTASKDAKVTVALPKKPIWLAIKSIEPSGDIRKGAPVLVYVDILALNGATPVPPATLGWPEISGEIVVTDGYDTCPIKLPLRSCSLTLNHAEVPKYIWATYQGDDNYGVQDSAHVLFTFNVVGAPSHFVLKEFASGGTAVTDIVAGQLFNLNVELAPDDPTAAVSITGNVVVTQGGKPFCTIQLVASGNSSTPLNAKGSCPPHPTLPLSGDSAGKNITLDLAYQGNGTYAVQNDTATIQVNKAPTVVKITSDLTAPTVVGQTLNVSFSVGVDPLSKGSGIPTGSVTVRDVSNTTDSCSMTLTFGSGVCSLKLTKLGVRALEAIYDGDGSFLNSATSSSTYFHTVNASSTLTTITAVTPLTSAEIGQLAKIEFTVQASGGGSGTPTGDVFVYQDGAYKCKGTLAIGASSCLALLDKINAVNFTAQYQGDGTSYLMSPASAAVQFTVSPAQTKTHIKSIYNPNPGIPANVRVEFEVLTVLTTDGSIPLSGPVDVVANGNTSVSCSDVSYPAVAICDLTLPNQGENTIKVTFKGSLDQRFAASTGANSESATFVVKQTTTLTLTTTQSNTVVDTPVMFTITIDTAGTQGSVTGKLTLSADSGETCSDITLAWPQKTYSCSLAFTNSGSHEVTATYVPDAASDYLTSTKTYTYSVVKASTTISGVTFTPASPEVGQSVSIGFIVSSPDTTVKPTGTVTVTASASETCSTSTLTDGTGACSLTFTNGGPRSLNITYTNGTRYIGNTLNTSQNVTPADTLTSFEFRDSSNNVITSAVVGQTVTLRATVTVPNNSTLNPTSGTVNISACSPTSIILSGSNVATCTTTYTAAGPVSVTAGFSPSAADLNRLSPSPTASAALTVNESPTTTSITFIPPSGEAVFGQTVTATIHVLGSGGGIPNSGTVSVTTTGPVSPGPSCSGRPVTAGTATCNLIFPAAGSWSVSASYTGSGGYLSSSLSPNASYNLAKAATTLSVTESTTPYLADQTVTFTLTLFVTAPGSGTPEGNFTITATPNPNGNPGPSTQTATWGTSSGNSHALTFNGAASWSLVAKYTDTSGNFQDYTLAAINYTTYKNQSFIDFNPPVPSIITANSLDVTISLSGNTPNGTPPAFTNSNAATVYAYDLSTLIDSCHPSTTTLQCTLNKLNTSGTIYTIYAVYNGNYLFLNSESFHYQVRRN
jgi:hypothetical protein